MIDPYRDLLAYASSQYSGFGSPTASANLRIGSFSTSKTLVSTVWPMNSLSLSGSNCLPV